MEDPILPSDISMEDAAHTAEDLPCHSAASTSSFSESIFLPTKSGSQIELRFDDLRDAPVPDLLALLKEEQVPLRYWVTIGRALLSLTHDDRVLDLIVPGAKEALAPTMGEHDTDERMEIINLVAAFYLSKFSKGNPNDDFDTKLEHLTTARKYFQDAEDQHLLVTASAWIGRATLEIAWYLLNKRAAITFLDCAYQYYETARDLVLDEGPELQHAHIGLGLVCHLKQEYKNAAVHYQNVFRCGPGPPNILFSLALCYLKLGEKDKMQEIVVRILQQHPDHLGSLCAMSRGMVSPTPEIAARLGVEEHTLGEHDMRVKWLSKVVEAHPGEPLPTVLLCDDLISMSGSSSDTWDILTAALPRCLDRNLQAEIHFQLGRLCHKKGKILDAEKHLRQCIDIFNGKHYRAMYTLAQVLGGRGEIAEATSILEETREAHPNDYNVLKLLSVTYAESEAYEQALECVNKCVPLQREPGDVNLWILQARCQVALLNKGDTYVDSAIEAYERLLLFLGQTESAESEAVNQCVILNNIGTLKFKKKDLDGALISYEKALKILDSQDGRDHMHLRATLIFNLACVHEERSEFGGAAERYHSLLQKYPWFTEPKSRLGSLELRQRNPAEALTHLEASKSLSLTNVLLTSEAYRQQGQYEKARSVVAQALKERELRDSDSCKTVATTEALAYLGTLHYEMALQMCPYKRAPHRDQHFHRAFQLFTKSYEGHPEGQPLAANGMAMVFAQKKEFNKAHRLFSTVLQMNESVHVKMNLGHTYMRGGATKVNPGAAPNPLDARKALRLYEAAWKHDAFADETERTHIAIAMALAHFVARDFTKGIEVLESAKERHPRNQQIIYNLAISKHGQASKVLKNTEERAKPDRVKDAVELLKQAKVGFESVINAFVQCKQSGSVPEGFEDLYKLEMKKVVGICRGRQTHCEDSIDQCNEWLQRQADSVTQMAARQRRDREKQLELMRQEEACLEEQRQKEEEEAEKKRKEAEELAESLMEVALGMQLPRETDKEPSKKKKDGDPEQEEEAAAVTENPAPEPKKVDLTEEEKLERQRRKDENRLAKMTDEERQKYKDEKDAKRNKRAEKRERKDAQRKAQPTAAQDTQADGEDAVNESDEKKKKKKKKKERDEGKRKLDAIVGDAAASSDAPAKKPRIEEPDTKEEAPSPKEEAPTKEELDEIENMAILDDLFESDNVNFDGPTQADPFL